ncbi:MAG: prepilin-type N-terminal cleavage/methylation domain-containing protein [Sideroxydans sp.]|nr:prepilin-type N-terminal cleavage/methylation domain-containing protein [Sideroxydans sp.]
MKNRKLSRQSGFTLVEIAIVLVIIGLLLGGVLKGQELIENAKVKNSVKDIQGISSAYYAYVDRFKRLPGDDGNLATLRLRGGTWAAATTPALTAGNNDGVLLDTAAQVFTPGAESTSFWQHLKASGLISGNANDVGAAAAPRNAFNGLIGLAAYNAAGTVTGAKGISICLSQVPGKAARAIDSQMDDGVTDSGSIRATLGSAGTNTAPGAAELAAVGYNDDNIYTICSTL